MPRSQDLDNIAPDDPVITIPPTETKNVILSPSSVKKKKKKTHNSPAPESATIKSPSESPYSAQSVKSSDLKFRQKIYELMQGKTTSSLSSFLARPKVFTFDTRDDDEEIILVLRRHWFTNVRWIMLGIFMLLTPILFPSVPLLSFFPDRYQMVFVIFWYLITFAIAFENFLSWYFNVFIITEERVIDIDFYNLLSKKFSEAKICMIQDVTSTQGGVSQILFNYGTVLIQTASEIPVIKIEMIPNPALVIKVLQQMRGEEEQEAIEGRIK